MSHLDEGKLHALLDGELDLSEVSEIQVHLGTCAACGARLQEVKQFMSEADRLVGALGNTRRSQPGAGRNSGSSHPLPSVASAFQSIPGARGVGYAGSPAPRHHRATGAASALDAALPMGCHDRCGGWGRPAGHECAASKRAVAGDRAGCDRRHFTPFGDSEPSGVE